MENTQLANILNTLFTARLSAVRISRVQSEKYKVAKIGGTIIATTSASLAGSKKDTKKAIAKVLLELKGFPEDSSNDTSDLVFRTTIEVNGVYTWPTPKTQDDFKNIEMNNLLCQPLFLYATKKAEASSGELGLSKLQLDYDLRTMSDNHDKNLQPPAEKDESAQKHTSQKPKKPTARNRSIRQPE